MSFTSKDVLLKYDVEIDYQIVNLLLHRKVSTSHNQIREHLRKSGKKISKPTHISHKKNLIASDHIRSSDNSIRGTEVKYCATEKAQEEEKLGILRFPFHSSDNRFPEAEKQLRSYFGVLFHACRSHSHVYTESNILFTNFVNRLSLSENDLRISDKDPRVPREGYPYSNISPLAAPRNPARYTLPGFSVSEIFHESKKHFQNILVTEEEIQKSADLLLNERCLKKITVSGGEIRYDLFEPSLKAFFEACWDLFLDLVGTILKKWQFVGKPTNEELAWLRRIYGRNVDACAREIHFERISFMRKDQRRFHWPKKSKGNCWIKKSGSKI